MTGQEVIEAALQELGILVSGGTLGSDDFAWGLGKMNRMLNSWSAAGINLHYRVKESFSLAGGTPDYTIGSGADFDTPRPNKIESAFIRDTGHDYPVGVRPISEYWDLTEKTTESRPLKLYYDPTYPDGTIYLYFTPDSAYSLYFISQKPLVTYPKVTTEILLPGEYEDAMVLGLAIRFAPRYGKAVSRDLRLSAKEAHGNLIGLNLSNQMKGVDLGLPGTRKSTYNIDADY